MNDYKPVKAEFESFKKLLLSDEKTLEAYEALSEEFLLIAEMIRARKRVEKTQKNVADLMETTSSVISRLESFKGQKKHSPTLETLRKYAHAVGCNLSIKFVPEHTQTTSDQCRPE